MQNEYATQWKEAAHLPYGIQGRVRKRIRDLALSTLALVGKNSPKKSLRCLFCHYVFDDQKEPFEKLIIQLKEMGTFIDTDACLDILAGKKEIQHNYFHLSFDDGFRNNFTNALPILQRHQVPAIFFVPTALMSADREAVEQYCLKTTRYRKPVEMMTWKDLGDILAAGYEIGSHTKSHARFSDISQNPVRLADEIAGSKDDIERNLGEECKYISWPFGTRADADAASLEHTKKAGYKACFGAFRGEIVPSATNPFSIPRHHFEVQWPLSHITYFLNGNMESTYQQASGELE